LNNNVNIKGKTTGGVASTLLYMSDSNYCVVGGSANVVATYISTNSTADNPLYIRVGGATKNVQIDGSGFLKGV
jgi:hypothetical protein